MGILWAFAPFSVYVIAAPFLEVRPGLISAFVVSTALLLRDWSQTKMAKVLDLV
jgi:hypothetical protein